MRVLACVDGSDVSATVIAHAARFASAAGLPLEVTRVLDPLLDLVQGPGSVRDIIAEVSKTWREEMAEQVGVDSRTTIYKDRQLLKDTGIPFVETERGRWKIDRQNYKSELRVNVYEAAMLYLMVRPTSRQTRSPNPYLLSA